MARILPRLVAAVGVAALTASLLAQRPAPAAASVAETPAVEPELPPGVVDATGTGLVIQRQDDGGLSLELRPGQPFYQPPGLLLTARGPLTPDQLDAIRAARPDESVITVYAYDPALPSQGAASLATS